MAFLVCVSILFAINGGSVPISTNLTYKLKVNDYLVYQIDTTVSTNATGSVVVNESTSFSKIIVIQKDLALVISIEFVNLN